MAERIVHLNGRRSYEQTADCTGPTGEHVFSADGRGCVFCDRGRPLIDDRTRRK